MPDIAALLSDGGTALPGCLAGTIVETYEDGSVMVTIAAFGDDHVWGPCPAMPRGEAAPEIGAACVVIFDDDRQPWVPVWHP